MASSVGGGRRWPRFETDARGLVDRDMALRFLWVGTAVAWAGAAISAFEPFEMSATARSALVGSQAVLGLMLFVATRLVDRVASPALVLVSAWACVVVATIVSLAIGHGAHALDLAFYPLVIGLVAVLVGTASALVMTIVCALVIALLALAEARGWVPGAAVLGRTPLSHPLTTHALLLLAGFAVGAILLRLSNASYREAKERESRFRGLLSIAAQHYWETDDRLCLTRCDDAATLQPSAVLAAQRGLPLTQLVQQLGMAADGRDAALSALQAHQPFHQLWLRLGAGYLQLSGQPRTDGDGRFIGYWGVAVDVTAQVQQELESGRTASMLNTTIEAVPDCLAVTDLATGRFRMVNQMFLDIFGYRREEVIGRTSAEIGSWAHPEDRAALLADLRAEGRVAGRRFVFCTRSGARIGMLVSASTLRFGDEQFMVLTARDITEAERTRQQYAAVLQHASIGIAFTHERRIVSANPFFERMFGWPEGSTIGRGAEVLGGSDEQCAALERVFAEHEAAGQPKVIEARLARRDGSRFWCRLQADTVAGDDPSGSGTIWIAEDVTDRHQAQRDLAAARDAAEAASQAKSQFLANTSHEIRTPLNGLLGLARLALGDAVTDAQRKLYLRHILESAQGLSAIMSDILDLSKIEAGKLDLEAAPFNLRGALEAVRQVNLPLAQAKGLDVTLELDPALPATVNGDATRVRQIVGNFVSNAIKFTERGVVRIEARPLADGRVRLAVHDSGIGIDPDVQGRLFAPFSQADQSTTRRYGGTGLGLSICRELAQLMDGQVGLASTPGQGSSFWVELPLPLAEAAPAVADAAAVAVDEAALRGARVLVAEDNAVNMMITVALLEQWGVSVAQATDGAQARDAVIAAARGGRPFDAVLMDVQMPVQSGHEAAAALRRQLGAALPPVIALTAAAMVSEREQALRSGMCDFLTKPVDASRMQHTLAHWVRRSRGAAA